MEDQNKQSQSTVLALTKTMESVFETYANNITLKPPHDNFPLSQYVIGAIVTIISNPDILLLWKSGKPESKLSIINAFFNSVQMGLPVGKQFGYAYFIPYGKEVNYQPDYKGLSQLLFNTGRYSFIESRVVYEGEEFTIEDGKIRHTPNVDLDDDDLNKRKLVYAIAHTKDGSPNPFIFLRKRDVEIRRNRSKSYQAYQKNGYTTPWINDTDEMWQKCAIRALFKKVPHSKEIALAQRLSDVDSTEAGSLDYRANLLELGFADPDLSDETIKEMQDIQTIDPETGEILNNNAPVTNINKQKDITDRAVKNMESAKIQ
jgi:phage RecT family recombinase